MSYDPKKDYAAAIARYIAYGDFKSAAAAEQLRNEKIEGEGITQYQKTFDYADYLPGGAKYTPDSSELLRAYIDRPEFSYDPAADELYGRYKKSYIRNGQYAMEDSMGQAAALSGGYGSSYAAEVGQQSYNDYLSQLNDLLPELYAQKRSEYEAAGEELYDSYTAALKSEELRSNEEQRLSAAQEEAKRREWDEAFQLWGELGYASGDIAATLGISEGTPTAAKAKVYYTKPKDETPQSTYGLYSLCMSMLRSGKMPGEKLLEMAGISYANARRILEGFMRED